MKKPTRTLAAGGAATVLAIGTLGFGATAATAAEPESNLQTISSTADTDTTLINGPLIDGPLVDIGGVLNALQIGQFQ